MEGLWIRRDSRGDMAPGDQDTLDDRKDLVHDGALSQQFSWFNGLAKVLAGY